jgi:hypothetical protein
MNKAKPVNQINCVAMLEMNKQIIKLLDGVFVISRIIRVEVNVVSRAEGEIDNAYQDLIYI